ncbi:MAG: D-2-hydroxyacid dehydrogenase family protein [Pelagibacteraceae bacterium]|nr:D-2-hydroxyacid dehydrogenase family protein [Pelagibacteraceae bacterium]
MKIAILDDYQQVAEHFADWQKVKDRCELKVFNEPFDDEDHAIENLLDFDVLIIMRERTPITTKLLNACSNLKLIITSGMRNKSIDLETCKQKNITVCGTDMHPNPTAELTWALILGLARNLREETENMYQGYWQTTLGTELKGKTLGVIGLGKQGTQVTNIAKAFGMEVIAWSENLKIADAQAKGALAVSKEDLLERSDFITIHLVLSERTKHIIKYEDICKMKPTAYLINTSRGEIIHEEDLAKALEENKIAGAGIDVYSTEPLPADHKLRFLPNALLLPHLGYVTKENYSLMYEQMLEDLEAYFDNNPIRVLT